MNRLKGVAVVHLRPVFFMENELFSVAVIKTMGVNGGTIKPDLPLPMIATRDIADEAAKLLAALDFDGRRVRELLGPRDYTRIEVTRVLGEAIGKRDLKYIQFPYDEVKKGMIAQGYRRTPRRI